MKKLNYLLLALMSLSISECTLFKKDIKKHVTVKIVAPEIFAVATASANYIKYLNNHSQTEYQNKFVENLISEGKSTHNVSIDNETASPDFIIQVKSLTITENDFVETINDAKSPNNGKQFLLNKVEANGEVIVLDAKTNKQISFNCTNIKSRQEKVKNNRDLGDLISGTNKDHSTYREKSLSTDIALQLAGDVGRRVWVPITKRIRKSLK